MNRLVSVRNLLEIGRTEDFAAVKVAIIDTGIHENHPLRNKLGGYYDFTDSYFVQGETPAKDNTGHGSKMVYLLNKTAPYAHIYVARVFQEDSGDANTALQVAKVSYRPSKALLIKLICTRQSSTPKAYGAWTSYLCHSDSKASIPN